MIITYIEYIGRFVLTKCYRIPPQGAFIEESRTLVYTLYTAYISYIRVYYLFTPLTLTINRVMSCRLLKYIYLAATVPYFIILYYAFFLLLTPSL
jgi:hypothetical protein